MKKMIRNLSSLMSPHAFLVFMGVLTIHYSSGGQGLYNQSNLYINEVNLYVDGEIDNSGLLVNDGLIGVSQDWTNQGVYRGKGALEVYGNTPQRIAHNDKLQKLLVKGWGTKFIRGSLNITEELHLIQGIMEVPEKNELSLNEKAIVYGGSKESYVEGAMTVEGTGYKFFPLGKNGIYAPIEFLDVQGTASKYSVEVLENAPVITIENTIVKNSLYWQRKDIVGQFGGSAVALEFDPSHFIDINKMILVAGSDWSTPFLAIEDVELSQEKDQLRTRNLLTAPIIMLGETSEDWAEADFYFSTALSPNASNIENQKAKIFGDRLNTENFHFEVFNRWGSLVYENNSLENMKTNGWDGRGLNGDHLISGPYPYRLIAYDKKGNRLEKKGVISILY